MRILVIGGGWAGLAAAVDAVEGGAELSLWDMAPQLGGRARSCSSVYVQLKICSSMNSPEAMARNGVPER